MGAVDARKKDCDARCAFQSTMNPFCAAVPVEVRRDLCESARSRCSEKGSQFSVSSIKDEVFILCSGVVAAVILESKGGSLGIYVAEPGFVGNIMRVAGATARHGVDFNDSHYAYALSDVRGCTIPLETVRSLFREDADFAELVLKQVTDHYKDALTSMTVLRSFTGEERIAWLLDQLERSGIELSTVTHDTIARLLGMNRVSVTRLMGSALRNRANGA